MALKPWVTAFLDARALPCAVLGPVWDGFDFGIVMLETAEGAIVLDYCILS
jgi:hypothetical protein